MSKKLILSIVAMLTISAGAFVYNQETVEVSENLTTITIDINPSVEIVTNDSGKVVKFQAHNDDGVALLEGINLKGMTVEAATELIFNRATELGYIDMENEDNAILITVLDENEDDEDDDELADELEEIIDELAEEEDIDIEVIKQSEGITDELKEQAMEYGVSNGKMMFMTKKAEKYGFEVNQELADMSIKEIQNMIKELTGNPSVDNGKNKDEEKPDMSDPEVREAEKAAKEAEKEARKANKTEDDNEDEVEENDED